MEMVTIKLTEGQAQELQPLFDIITARNRTSMSFDFAIAAQPEMVNTVSKTIELTCALVDRIAKDTIRGAIKDMKDREKQVRAMQEAIAAARETA